MLKKSVEDRTRVVSFNAAVYRLNAIKRAARKFRGCLSVLIEQRGHSNEVRLIPTGYCTSLYALMLAFCDEVLDQELRQRVALEMDGMRSLLLAQAFSRNAMAKCT
jgi:His-Xaa-Ser system protein HxsD